MNRSRPKFGALHLGGWSRYRYDKKTEEERIMDQKYQSEKKSLEDKLSEYKEKNEKSMKELIDSQNLSKELKNDKSTLMSELNSLKDKLKGCKEANNEFQIMKKIQNQQVSEITILKNTIKEFKEKELEVHRYNEKGGSRNNILGTPISSFNDVFDQKWTFKAKIIQKGEIVKIEPHGTMISITLKDNSGEITVTAFDKEAEMFHNLALLGNDYFISNHVVKGARIRSSIRNCSYKISFKPV